MNATHRVLFGDARELAGVEDESAALVVTSPPYPMIEMWDGIFAGMDGFIEGPLKPGECESVRFEIPPLDKPTVNEVTVTCDIVGSDEKKKMVSAEALCDCTSGEAAMVTLPIDLN